MEKTVGETIKEITQEHLTKHNGLLLGQAITAVGFVNNTVPNCEGIIELSNADVAGAGIAVGCAVAGRRPIFVLRYQDLLFLNGSIIINYAAKTKDMFGRVTPIFVRALASEGTGTGPVLSGKLHSIFMHFPGFRVWAPMTPGEYREVWQDFMDHDDPVIVSEHRRSFPNKEELPDIINENAEVTIMGISSARFNIGQAAKFLEQEGIHCNVLHVVRLKPLLIKDSWVEAMKASQCGIVVDSGFEMAGAAQSLAYEMMFRTGVKVKALGIFDRSVGCTPETENLTPSAERIVVTVRGLVASVRLRQNAAKKNASSRVMNKTARIER